MPVQAKTPTETAVMRIWTELFGVPPSSTQDDFFELGGESVTMVRFLARVQDAYGVELSVETLFAEDFTVAQAAREIDRCLLAGVDDTELNALLTEVDRLSDDEVHALLAEGA